MMRILYVIFAIILVLMYYHFINQRKNIIINETKCEINNKEKCY